jgi:hypothetical protein
VAIGTTITTTTATAGTGKRGVRSGALGAVAPQAGAAPRGPASGSLGIRALEPVSSTHGRVTVRVGVPRPGERWPQEAGASTAGAQPRLLQGFQARLCAHHAKAERFMIERPGPRHVGNGTTRAPRRQHIGVVGLGEGEGDGSRRGAFGCS